MTKDVKKYLRWLTHNGFEVKMTKSSHWKVYRDGTLIAVLPSTPSDHRAMKNVRNLVDKTIA